MPAGEAGGGNWAMMPASVANKLKIVCVKRKRQKTGGAESLPATMFAESDRGGTATIMENESLGVVGEIFCDGSEEGIGKIAIFEKILTIFEVDKGDFGRDGDGFGFLRESDESIVGFGEVVVSDERGGGTLKTGDF